MSWVLFCTDERPRAGARARTLAPRRRRGRGRNENTNPPIAMYSLAPDADAEEDEEITGTRGLGAWVEDNYLLTMTHHIIMTRRQSRIHNGQFCELETTAKGQ